MSNKSKSAIIKEGVINLIKSNVKSSFKDDAGEYYVIFNDGTISSVNSEVATNTLMELMLDTDLYLCVDSNYIAKCLSDYVRAITKNVKNVFNRVGVKFDNEHNIESLYIKLNKFQVVKVSKGQWSVINALEDQDVQLIIGKASLDIPLPQEGGNVEMLKSVINYGSETNFKLLVAWIVYTFFPGECGAKPLLAIHAEQGSGKSKTSEFLKQLIDPETHPLTTIQNPQDIMLLANHDWLTVLDNLSCISHKFSDILCQILTGGSFKKKKNYKDGDIYATSFKKPLILNGIHSVIRNPDLGDRSIYINLPRLSGERITESELNTKFEALRPQIFGAVLDVMAKVLEILPTITCNNLPRMSDYARVGIAIEKILGWGDGAFLEAFYANEKDMVYASIENDTLINCIVHALDFLEHVANTKRKRPHKSLEDLFILRHFTHDNQMIAVRGTPTNVYGSLKEYYERMLSGKYDGAFPRGAVSFGMKLAPLVPQLKKIGIYVSTGKYGDDRNITIRRGRKLNKEASNASERWKIDNKVMPEFISYDFGDDFELDEDENDESSNANATTSTVAAEG